MNFRIAVRLGAFLAAALVLSACRAGGSRFVLPVAFEEPHTAATLRYPDDFGSHEAAVRGVASLLSRELALPVPDHVMVYIYTSRAVFEQGLVTDGLRPSVTCASRRRCASRGWTSRRSARRAASPCATCAKARWQPISSPF